MQGLEFCLENFGSGGTAACFPRTNEGISVRRHQITKQGPSSSVLYRTRFRRSSKKLRARQHLPPPPPSPPVSNFKQISFKFHSNLNVSNHHYSSSQQSKPGLIPRLSTKLRPSFHQEMFAFCCSSPSRASSPLISSAPTWIPSAKPSVLLGLC